MDGTDVANRLLGGVLLAVLTGLAAWLLLGQAGLSGRDGWFDQVPDPFDDAPSLARGGDADLQPPPRDFAISDAPDIAVAAAAGLYPGGTQVRHVRVSNHNAVDIRVTSVTAMVRPPIDSSGHPASGCPASSLLIEPLGAPVLVQAHAATDLALVARLAADAPDACKNVHFPLSYSGTASQP